MRQNTIALVAVLLSLLAAGARGEGVGLRTGRALTGRIIKEDESSVTIELKSGEMTVQRTQIKEVRKSPPPAPPVVTGKSGTKKAGDAASQRAPQASPPATPPAPPPKDMKPAKSFADRLAEMEEVRLSAWPE